MKFIKIDEQLKYCPMKKMIRSILLITAATLLNTFYLAAQDDMDAKLGELLSLMNVEQQFVGAMEDMIEIQKQTGQDAMLPEGFYEAFIAEAKSSFGTDLLPKFKDIYKENYTLSEVNQLIDFYKSDLGQTLVETTPAITKASTQIGATWGQELAMKVMTKLNAKE